MNIKKVFGSFIFALIISVFLQLGQSQVLAADCTGSISITNTTTLSTDKKADYLISMPTNTCGQLSINLYDSNNATALLTIPLNSNQLTEVRDNSNNIVGYKYTGSLDLSSRFPAGQTFNMVLTLKDPAGNVVANTPSQTVTSFGSAEPGPSPAPNPVTNGTPIEAVQENTADGKPALKFTAVIKDGDLPGTTEVCAKELNGGTPVCKSYTINSQQDIDNLKASGVNIQQDLGTGDYLITDKLILPAVGKYAVTITNNTNPTGYIITKDVVTNAPYQEAPDNGGGGSTTPGGSTGSGGGASTVPDSKFTPKYSGSAALDLIKSYVKNGYLILFPLALVVAVIKILINLIQMGASQGDPNKLNQLKDELLTTIVGIIVIGGAVTFINIIGSALGI